MHETRCKDLVFHFHAANPERERGKRHYTSGDWEGEWEIWMAFEGVVRNIMQGRAEVAEIVVVTLPNKVAMD